jgi:hypothetical protein
VPFGHNFNNLNIQRMINIFFITWFGSIIGHILSLYKPEFKRTLPFFEKVIPGKSEAFYFRLDFAFLPLIGAVLGLYLIDPQDAGKAIFTGLTWSGTLIAMLQKEPKTQSPEP